ncbi:BMP family ABC transporter substrate-binding protein [Vibrio sp. PP-XX7]
MSLKVRMHWRAITQLAKAGNDLIFTASFGFMQIQPSKQPNSSLKLCLSMQRGYRRAKNLSAPTRFATYEGRYVSGVAAGLRATKSNVTVSYTAPFPIPEVGRDINAAYLGAKSVNPNVKMKIVWVNTWYDPGKESDAANALIDQGVDVLLQHTDSPAPLLAAEKRGVLAIGQASRYESLCP